MDMPDNVDISRELQEQRKQYERFRERAALLSKSTRNSDLKFAMVEYSEKLEAAIASIDEALRIVGACHD